jgi:hypothetical protein
LQPVTFTYKDDATDTIRYGVIAEQAYQVYPEMVKLDDQGRPDSISVPMEMTWMMLNEIQKSHTAIEMQQTTIALLEARLSTLEGVVRK